MLLAGLQRQDKSSLPVFIDGCTSQPSGDTAHILFARREDSQVWTSVIDRIAEALTFSDHEIRAAGARGF
ncbi:MAG: hypothetical protein BWX99_02534 [Deltaproteobacteria bacterium ADurb.Bin151]|nr:MAG: hypothetical protein BWX99_02534 [Deltaproteobacteria bacterium ADurb.Bin151]